MQLQIPADLAHAAVRPALFGKGASLLIVNQSAIDFFMSDFPGELNASAIGNPVQGGTRIGNSGGQVLWPASLKTAFFRAMMPWPGFAGAAAVVLGQVIIDRNGHVQKVTTAGNTAAGSQNYPAFVTNGGTTNDGTAVWTDQGPAVVQAQIIPG